MHYVCVGNRLLNQKNSRGLYRTTFLAQYPDRVCGGGTASLKARVFSSISMAGNMTILQFFLYTAGEVQIHRFVKMGKKCLQRTTFGADWRNIFENSKKDLKEGFCSEAQSVQWPVKKFQKAWPDARKCEEQIQAYACFDQVSEGTFTEVQNHYWLHPAGIQTSLTCESSSTVQSGITYQKWLWQVLLFVIRQHDDREAR